MAYERWAKRMDDAVLSSWLRGLRSEGRAQPGSTAQRLLKPAQRANTSLGKLDRTVATAER
jgi:hypothetical protein